MKKLIAIAVVFILAVGVAFAADVSATVQGGVTALQGDSKDGSKVQAGGAMTKFMIDASGQNEEGTFGGYLRFVQGYYGGPGASASVGGEDLIKALKDFAAAAGDADKEKAIKLPLSASASGIGAYGLAWWQPHEIFRLTIGNNQDGLYDHLQGNSVWNFYKIANDVGVTVQDYSNFGFRGAFFGGISDPSAILTLTPLESLQIVAAIPFISAGGNAVDVYKKFIGQVTYNLSGIGTIGLTYRGSTNEQIRTYNEWGPLNSKLYGYFGFNGIDSLAVDLGVGYIIPVTNEVEVGAKKIEETYSGPVAVGVAVAYTKGALGLKVRAQGQLGEKWVKGGSTDKGLMRFSADLLPSFDITDSVTALLDTGLVMSKFPEAPAGVKDYKATVGWHIMPYVTVKASWWAPNFYAGIRFWGDGDKDNITKWSIPVGIAFGF